MNHPNSQFSTTRWTLVWDAAREDSSHGRPALEELMRRYWQPLYSFARRTGLSREDGEDATQEFLSRLIRGELLQSADPAKGKFRSFLLVAWKRFLTDEYRKRNTQRRGRGVTLFSLDFGAGEQHWQRLQSRESDPDRLFARSWADTLLDETRQRLKQSYELRDRGAVFEKLIPKITESLTNQQYAELGRELGLSSSAVKVAMHRLRSRFGETLREVSVETLDDPGDVESEISELLAVLTR